MRPLRFDNRGELKKKISLCSAVESMSDPETLPLRNARNREWLARKTGSQNIMLRYICHLYVTDIADRPFTIPSLVGPLRMLIPLTGKKASTINLAQSAAETANACEE